MHYKIEENRFAELVEHNRDVDCKKEILNRLMMMEDAQKSMVSLVNELASFMKSISAEYVKSINRCKSLTIIDNNSESKILNDKQFDRFS